MVATRPFAFAPSGETICGTIQQRDRSTKRTEAEVSRNGHKESVPRIAPSSPLSRFTGCPDQAIHKALRKSNVSKAMTLRKYLKSFGSSQQHKIETRSIA